MKYLILVTLLFCSCDRLITPICTEKERQERKEYLIKCFTETSGGFCAGRAQEIFRCNPNPRKKERKL